MRIGWIVVENVSDRVAVIYLGQIVETETRDQVFADPRHPYTRRLIEAVPTPYPKLRRTYFARLEREISSAVRALGDPPSKHVGGDGTLFGFLAGLIPVAFAGVHCDDRASNGCFRQLISQIAPHCINVSNLRCPAESSRSAFDAVV